MIIGKSAIQMEASHSFQSKQKQEILQKTGNETHSRVTEMVVQQESTAKKSMGFVDMMKTELIDESTEEMEQSMLGMKSPQTKASKVLDRSEISSYRQIQRETLSYLLRYLREIIYESIYGKKENSEFGNQLQSISGSGQTLSGWSTLPSSQVIASSDYYASYEEMENTTFATKGKVVTAEGREIEFGVELEMTRSFREEYLEHHEIVAEMPQNMLDSLVINLNQNAATVSDQKFLFDLDQDGILDSISRLGQGNGFLALDRNEDGIINDGSELFGTKSGDGFRDLAEYDADNNGWIDEADEIFDKLLIWTKNANGEDELLHLKEAGIGAICLERVSTDFSLKSLKNNTLNGAIRESGIFLYENGTAGLVQHVDLAT